MLFLNNDSLVAPDLLTAFVTAAHDHRGPDAAALSGETYFLSDPQRLWYARTWSNAADAAFEHVGQDVADSGDCFEQVGRRTTPAGVPCPPCLHGTCHRPTRRAVLPPVRGHGLVLSGEGRRVPLLVRAARVIAASRVRGPRRLGAAALRVLLRSVIGSCGPRCTFGQASAPRCG